MEKMYTDKFKLVLQIAKQESIMRGRDCADTEHLLLAIVRDDDNLAAKIFRDMGLVPEYLTVTGLRPVDMAFVLATEAAEPELYRQAAAQPFSSLAEKVVEVAAEEAEGMNNIYIGTEHLLLALLKYPGSAAANALYCIGLEYGDNIKETIARVMRGR